MEIDDSNLAQCEFCGYVTDRDDIPTANDPYSDGTVTVCPECNEGESFVRYPAMIDRELLELALDALECIANDGWLMHGPEGMDVAQTKCVSSIEALRSRLAETEADIWYEVLQDGEWQAGANSLAEVMHYDHQYAEDVAVEVQEVTRRVICKIEN